MPTEILSYSGTDPKTSVRSEISPMTGNVGAVVIGGDYQGLGIVRSLGRHGIPICVIDDEHSIARFSHYVQHFVPVPSLRREEEIVAALRQAGDQLGLDGWVVYPTRDEMVAALSRHRDELSLRFRIATASWDAVQWAWDKRNTYRRAAELGIPTPRTWYPETDGDLAAIDAEFPLVLKPAIKEHFFYKTRSKAWQAKNRDELVRKFRTASGLAPGEIMVQEFIPGEGVQQLGYCTFFKERRAIGSMVAQRTRQHPRQFGRASTFVESISFPELEQLSEHFLAAIGYYGLAEMEYKLDARDGRPKLLDFNARTWGYVTLGERAGVDFPYLLFADQTGQDAKPCQGQSGRKWMRLVTDVPAALIEIARGDLGLRPYLRSLTSSDSYAVISRDDLLPSLMELAMLPYLMYKRGF